MNTSSRVDSVRYKKGPERESGQRTKESFEEIIRKTDEFINATEKMPEGFDKEQKIGEEKNWSRWNGQGYESRYRKHAQSTKRKDHKYKLCGCADTHPVTGILFR